MTPRIEPGEQSSRPHHFAAFRVQPRIGVQSGSVRSAWLRRGLVRAVIETDGLTLEHTEEYTYRRGGRTVIVFIGESHAFLEDWPELDECQVGIYSCGSMHGVEMFRGNVELQLGTILDQRWHTTSVGPWALSRALFFLGVLVGVAIGATAFFL